jgi:hypothetical protein
VAVVFIVKSDAAVASWNFTHEHFLPCLMVSDRSDRLSLRGAQPVDSSFDFATLLP